MRRVRFKPAPVEVPLLSVMMTCPVLWPRFPGVKTTETVQLAPATNEPVQVFDDAEKSVPFAPTKVTGVDAKVIAVVPVFLSVIFCAVLGFPPSWLPYWISVGVTVREVSVR